MAYSSKLKSEQTDGFFEAILSLETMEECYRFFEDICTIKEIQAIAQRLEVATGASTATISRINRSLNYGADGYKLIFKKLGLED